MFICMMEYYSAIKVQTTETTWINLKKHFAETKKPDTSLHEVLDNQTNLWRHKPDIKTLVYLRWKQGLGKEQKIRVLYTFAKAHQTAHILMTYYIHYSFY